MQILASALPRPPESEKSWKWGPAVCVSTGLPAIPLQFKLEKPCLENNIRTGPWAPWQCSLPPLLLVPSCCPRPTHPGSTTQLLLCMSFYILSRQGPRRVHTDSKYMRLCVSSSVSYASGQLFDIVSVMAYMPLPSLFYLHGVCSERDTLFSS